MYIYHFTKFELFLKIIKSGVFFFSNLKNANDPTEGEYQRRIIIDILKEVDKSTNLCPMININTTKNEDLNLYSISFSSELDNVHNWKEYGDDAKGVSIFFDYEKLVEILKKTGDYLQILEVCYDVKNIKKRIIKTFEAKKDNKDDAEFYRGLLLLYPYIKHQSYSIEKEYRIAFINEECSSCCMKDFFYYDLELKHYVLSFKDLVSNDVVSRIELGSNMTLLHKQIIEDLLKEYGYDIDISISSVPIRA